MPDLEIDLLRTFAAVASTRGFTAAGEALGLTQSAVSQKVKRLEDLTGRRLLDRTSRSLSLTPEGEEFLEYARRMLSLNDEAVGRMMGGQALSSLRLGVTEDFVPAQLSALIRHVAGAMPELRLSLATGLSTRLLESLGQGELDLVVAKKDEQRHQGGMVVRRERLAWIASGDFRLEPGGPLPLVMLPAPCSYRAVMLSALAASGLGWRDACTAGSIAGVKAAVEAGLGVSILGASFIGEGIRELSGDGLPSLPQTEIAIFGPGDPAGRLTAILKEALSAALG